jgi:hypothetical protein
MSAAPGGYEKVVSMRILRNALAIVIGLAIGGGINMAIVVVGPSVIPPPADVDVTDMESIRASIHLFEVKHYVTPFLAHAAGTLAGSLVAFVIAASYRSIIAYGIGVAFLAGGIAASFMIPAPQWFIVLDLLFAYIPMAWIGVYLGRCFARRNTNDFR